MYSGTIGFVEYTWIFLFCFFLGGRVRWNTLDRVGAGVLIMDMKLLAHIFLLLLRFAPLSWTSTIHSFCWYSIFYFVFRKILQLWGVLYDGGMGFVWDCRKRSYGAALLAKAACLRAWASWAWRFASFCSYFLRQSISWTLVTANFILRSFAGLTMGVSKK